MTITMLDAPITQQLPDESPTTTDQHQSESTPIPTVPPEAPAAESPAPPLVSDASAAPATAEETREAAEEDEDVDSDDPVISLERDATEFDKATITVVLQLLPHDGHADGRLVLLGVKSHNLPPLTSTRRLAQISPLPEELTHLLTRWEQHYREALTARTQQRAADKAKEKVKEEERKRKQEEARRHAKSKPAAQAPQTRTASTSKAGAAPAPPPAVTAPQPEAAPQSTLF